MYIEVSGLAIALGNTNVFPCLEVCLSLSAKRRVGAKKGEMGKVKRMRIKRTPRGSGRRRELRKMKRMRMEIVRPQENMRRGEGDCEKERKQNMKA